jgi:hypothetical protein
MSDKYADKLLRTGGAVSISEALIEQQRNEIERLRAALKNLYGLMCDMENDGHVTESLYNGVMQHTKEALGEDA